MSSQKEKYLASAQKFIQKGQFDRALKDYEQVVTADPKDVKHRQKLAELMIRCNRKDDAVKEYETIAKYYDENGFYLKSIAVYKQIQRLDTSNIEISLALAVLNEKQGMIGNALSEYRIVFDYYEGADRKEEAIKILERMQGVDPDNVDIVVKLAETYHASGDEERAYEEFKRAAIILKKRGESSLFERVCGRIHALYPEKNESALDIYEEQLKGGAVDDIVSKLRQVLTDDPENIRALELLADACHRSGDMGQRVEVLKQLHQYDPDGITAKAGLIECCVEAGELEESLDLLDRFADDLLAAGSFADLEKFFTTLQNLAPYDLRLLKGLKKLYETTGDRAKLADVQVSLNILNQKDDSSETTDEGPVEPANDTYSSSMEFQWEEEMDLSFGGDIDPDSLRTETPPGSDLSDENIQQDSGSDGIAASRGDFEIDISFDLSSDDELAPPAQPVTNTELLELRDLELSGLTSGHQEDMSGGGIEIDLEELAPLTEEAGSAEFFPVEADEAVFTEEDEIILVADHDEVSAEPEVSLDEPLVTMFDEVAPAADGPVSPAPDPALAVTEPDSGKYALEGVFNKFKEDLDEQVDIGDTETHFNLGIAYMEMGLYDDAVKEFAVAGKDPSRKIDSLTLHGRCCRLKGDLDGAERVLDAALVIPGLEGDGILNLRYELGLLREASGRKEEALATFREIFAVNPGFRDTMKKISLLSGAGGSFDFSDIELEDIELEELK
jgi:tetratricopeptide (TPR) repeat protein